MKKIYLIPILLICLISFVQAQCDSNAGLMSTELVINCQFSSLEVNPTEQSILDDNDILRYFVHDSNTNELGNVLSSSSNTTINYTPNISYGTTYYVSAVVGNPNGQGSIDLDDPCLSVSIGTPIIFEEVIDINISEVLQTCSGEDAIAECNLPEGYTLALEGMPVECPVIFPFSGFHMLTLTSPLGCEREIYVEVLISPQITADVLTENDLDCENTSAQITTVVSNGVAPYTYTWSHGETVANPQITYPGEYCVTITDSNGCTYISCVNVNTDYSDCATIEGTIFKDENENCALDDGETTLSNRLVTATSADGQYYSYTDATGLYNFPTPPGTYQVNVINQTPDIWQNCPTQEVVLTNENETTTADFGLQPLVDCPLMSVDLSTWVMRRCFSMNYAVHYCNKGTVPATDAYIEVNLDQLLEVQSSTAPFTNPEPGLYVFDLGNVDIGECGNFLIETYLSCDAQLGQTLCNQAVIYPNEPCEPPSSWNGASVEVTGSCNEEQVQFFLKNVGIGNMDEPSTYIVIEDGAMLSSEPIEFELEAGASQPLTFPANGSTYIVQAMQVEGHPGFSAPSAAVEACGTNMSGESSQGFILQFPLDENDLWVSEDCREVTGSYDPNDKQAFPRGFGDDKLINANQDIEYLIRFQNTGTDTAFTVRINDVLSSELDMTTLRPGASSHPYELNIRGADTLEFIFDNILLPDSFVNEPASHGFVQFKVSQKPDLAVGTLLENTADIYFDFNEAIVTNTVTHQIGEEFLPTTDIQNAFVERLSVEIAPNPTKAEWTVRLLDTDFANGLIRLFDINGKVIDERKFNNHTITMPSINTGQGLYFYKIYLDDTFAASGKVVVLP